MLRKLLAGMISVAFFVFVLLGFYLLNPSRQWIIYGQERVIYNLPYPGLLPDHPLYPVKAVRDRLMDIVTRDYVKKANLYLLFADKRVNMALMLSKKGKSKQAVTILSKAEKYFSKIPNLLIASKKQGVSPPSDFIETLKLSNAKHREIINQFLKTPSMVGAVREILQLNQEIKDELEKL